VTALPAKRFRAARGARLAAALALTMFCGAVLAQAAAKVYVTREFKAGLHEEKAVDSAIITLVSSGTALEIIKREDPLSFVRTPDGVTGWIDNSYLVAAAPTGAAEVEQARERADAAERRVADLQRRITELEARPEGAVGGGDTNMYQALKKQHADLEQDLKEERLRAGELQVQVTELRKRVGMNADNAALYDRIDELEAKNKELEVALAGAPQAGSGAAAAPGPGVRLGYRSLAAWLALALVGGFGGGIYLMDYLNRRRHGGFRV
jgi:SH3 domain protein